VARLDVDGDLFIVSTAYRERDLIKSVPGARWDRDRDRWVVPLSWGSAQALRGVFGPALELSTTAIEWGQSHVSNMVGPALALRDKEDVELSGADHLWPHQRVGVAFLTHTRRALLSDEMGLGKTVQLIEAAKRLEQDGSLPLLVVCPNSLKWNWERELKRWWPEVRVEVVAGSASKRRKTLQRVAAGEIDVAIINWEALRLFSRLAPFGSTRLQTCKLCDELSTKAPSSCERCEKELNAIAWGTVIADEAHRAKESSAKQTRALWQVARQAKYCFLATGTPVANSPDDLWSLMHTIAPDEWPAKSRFIERYCLASYNPFGGLDVVGLHPATKDEFFRILDPRFIRRTKVQVIKDLPEKIYVTRSVEMSDKQAKAYEQMEKGMVAEIEGGMTMSFNGLTVLTRLLQFASAYATLTDDGERVVLMDPSSKIDALLEIIEETDGESMVVFAVSKQLVKLTSDRLTKKGIAHGVVHGDITGEARQDEIDGFQAGEFPILLATVGSIAEGVTLTRAQTCVFMQRSFSLIQNRQAEDRVYARVNDIHGAMVIDLVSHGTVEERTFELLREKADRLEEVARDKAALLRLLKGE
jgi:SNF2 family DNA or RNA helicase